MKLSYEGIGQWAASFACQKVNEGEVVKVSENGMVAACAEGDAFCGMVLALSRDDACSVAMGGMVTAGYTGAAPVVGWAGLVSDGAGGVKSDASGRSYLVVEVDQTANTVTFAL